jgi:hypothetical protein
MILQFSIGCFISPPMATHRLLLTLLLFLSLSLIFSLPHSHRQEEEEDESAVLLSSIEQSTAQYMYPLDALNPLLFLSARANAKIWQPHTTQVVSAWITVQ